MNYEDMPAGPEMDRLIAEKVMGIVGARIVEVEQTCEVPTGLRFLPWRSFSPSTNIAHAWEVVAVIRNKSPNARYYDFAVANWSDGETVTAGFMDFEGGTWYIASKADAAPLAICRAALKAMAA